MNTEFLKSDRKEWVFHLLFWSLLIASLIFGNAWTRIFPDRGVFLVVTTLITPVYVNAFILIPRYFTRSRWPLYLLLLVILLLAVNVVSGLLIALTMITDGKEINFVYQWYKWAFHDYRSFDKFVFSGTTWPVYLSFAYRFIKDWIINERVKEKLVSEKLSMELALLRSQVNPHFLFNTLNNIYALALEEKAVGTADTIATLGNLMRYSLHDAQADFITLRKEIDYVEQYVTMQRLRLTENTHLKMSVEADEPGSTHATIAPMILMPFIENAFKYGVSITHESRISIRISISENGLLLRVENTVHHRDASEAGGFGLANVRHRLALLYPDQHQLVYGTEGEVYKVRLELHLS